MWTARLAVIVAVSCAGCAPAAPPPEGPTVEMTALFGGVETASPGQTGTLQGARETSTSEADPRANRQSEQARCAADEDCGYDPVTERCGADPRLNKQPPLEDQGIVCYCEAVSRQCETLRVWPAPCEGESACAIALDPRPHPVRATRERPYVKPALCLPPKPGKPRATRYDTTCERTNICTMHVRDCAAP